MRQDTSQAKYHCYNRAMQRRYVAIIGLVVVLSFAGILLWNSRVNFVPHLISQVVSARGESFPGIDESNLTPAQKRIVSIARTEFMEQPEYTKYTEGNKEAWCADFVSWVYMSAGVPFTNQNSGSWRIPGTYTLRDYLEKEGLLRLAKSDYEPKTGDLMLYDNPNSFGQHVNIVVTVHSDGSVTTIGGNEPGGIRVKTHSAYKEPGFVGYGVLE